MKSSMKDKIIFRARDIDIYKPPRVDCHLHTSWTDGDASVSEVYEASVSAKLEAVLFSEHSRKSSVGWFADFAAEVRALPKSPCAAFVGTEVKVESWEGQLDTVKEITECCDLIMASVHRFIDSCGVSVEFQDFDPDDAIDTEFRLACAALKNPEVDILGHMFGMSYRRFNQTPPDELVKELISLAAHTGVAVEVNSRYHPNVMDMLRWCQEFDANVAFGSNAHSLVEVGQIIRHVMSSTENE